MRWQELWSRALGSEESLEPFELARAYADMGLHGLPMRRTNPNSDFDADRMAAHFGADLHAAPPDWLGVVRDVERVCSCCRTLDRCHRWFKGRAAGDTPERFCPNAETFQQLASAERRDGD
jgi:hypothetical protein